MWWRLWENRCEARCKWLLCTKSEEEIRKVLATALLLRGCSVVSWTLDASDSVMAPDDWVYSAQMQDGTIQKESISGHVCHQPSLLPPPAPSWHVLHFPMAATLSSAEVKAGGGLGRGTACGGTSRLLRSPHSEAARTFSASAMWPWSKDAYAVQPASH